MKQNLDLFFLNLNYFYFLFFIFVTFCIIVALFFVSYFLMQRNIDIEKMSAYECGFDPFEESLGRFDIKFYLVAILFLIFDLEIVFLFPWSVMLYFLDVFTFWIIFIFIFVLTLGFIYEWSKGALDWS
jgi:NADH:ubiquinone oxidoreductase subunit 3 (subunit A)